MHNILHWLTHPRVHTADTAQTSTTLRCVCVTLWTGRFAFCAYSPVRCLNVTMCIQQEKGGRQQLVPQPRFGQMLSAKARLIVLASSILIITAASIGTSI